MPTPTQIDWNTTSNFILAIIAIVGFISSFIISIVTLYRTRKIDKHNKEIQDKQIKIDLFENRYNLFVDILVFFSSKGFADITTENRFKSLGFYTILPLLFDKTAISSLFKLLGELIDYYNKESPLPDYTHLKIAPDNVQSIQVYAVLCLESIRDYMTL